MQLSPFDCVASPHTVSMFPRTLACKWRHVQSPPPRRPPLDSPFARLLRLDCPCQLLAKCLAPYTWSDPFILPLANQIEPQLWRVCLGNNHTQISSAQSARASLTQPIQAAFPLCLPSSGPPPVALDRDVPPTFTPINSLDLHRLLLVRVTRSKTACSNL